MNFFQFHLSAVGLFVIGALEKGVTDGRILTRVQNSEGVILIA